MFNQLGDDDHGDDDDDEDDMSGGDSGDDGDNAYIEIDPLPQWLEDQWNEDYPNGREDYPSGRNDDDEDAGDREPDEIEMIERRLDREDQEERDRELHEIQPSDMTPVRDDEEHEIVRENVPPHRMFHCPSNRGRSPGDTPIRGQWQEDKRNRGSARANLSQPDDPNYTEANPGLDYGGPWDSANFSEASVSLFESLDLPDSVADLQGDQSRFEDDDDDDSDRTRSESSDDATENDSQECQDEDDFDYFDDEMDDDYNYQGGADQDGDMDHDQSYDYGNDESGDDEHPEPDGGQGDHQEGGHQQGGGDGEQGDEMSGGHGSEDGGNGRREREGGDPDGGGDSDPDDDDDGDTPRRRTEREELEKARKKAKYLFKAAVEQQQTANGSEYLRDRALADETLDHQNDDEKQKFNRRLRIQLREDQKKAEKLYDDALEKAWDVRQLEKAAAKRAQRAVGDDTGAQEDSDDSEEEHNFVVDFERTFQEAVAEGSSPSQVLNVQESQESTPVAASPANQAPPPRSSWG